MRLVCIGANNPESVRIMNKVRGKDAAVEVLGFVDNDPAKRGTDFHGLPVFGGFECIPDLLAPDVRFVNLITRDTVTRFVTSRQVHELGGRFANLIHPDVDLEMVRMGVGNYVQERVVLQAMVTIGNNASVHIGSMVGHETHIGNSVFIAHGCNVSGLVHIEDGAFLGTGATILPRLRIGKWAVIGAGAVVLKDVPPGAVVVGNPGRVIRTIEPAYETGDPLK
jgi:sugar O-acyltransferase (sialic acid O-acetyltransferase NeuD family)